ncbi:MAG: hypothetical protein IJC31_03615 [Spirochaetaceae bacterium]|nr:hypothetical protein [Spirochaetaceae bacterium]
MTGEQWERFSNFREEFRRHCQEWNDSFRGMLEPLQREACRKDTPEYSVETSVVYNQSLDQVTADSTIKLLVIGDNPGKDEQRLCNQRYLVGQAGKLAAGFFSRNPDLGIDFRRDTIILNKTPVHTAKTTHLRHLLKYGPPEIRELIGESQSWMARETAALHQALAEGGQSESGGQLGTGGCQLWLVGYAELKGRGLFLGYRDQLARSYQVQDDGDMVAAWNQVMVYQHFSMNRFTIDLAQAVAAGKVDGSLSVQDQLACLGAIHRREIFGV